MKYTVTIHDEPADIDAHNVLQFAGPTRFVRDIAAQLRRNSIGDHIVFSTRGNISVTEEPE